MDVRLEAFQRLLDIMDDLREKCPWDKKQTFESLQKLTIEETYELIDAITEKDYKNVKEEIGDLFLHLVFYCKLGDEIKEFDITDALNTVCDKLIHRHPHIYGDVKVENEADVKRNWEQLKLKEGKKSILDGVPNSLPAIIKSYRIQDKVKNVGFDWEDTTQVWAKVQEELEELQEEININSSSDKTEEEFGDVLFSLINYARHLGIDPERALNKTNKKFIHRFQYIEQQAKNTQQSLEDLGLEQMEIWWKEAK